MDSAHLPYTFGMATGEIISLLLLSFVAGILFCRLLRQMGVCCLPKKKTVSLGITPVPADKNHTRDLDIHTSNLHANDVYVPKVAAQPIITLPEITAETNELPPMPDIDPLLATIDPHKPILDLEVPEQNTALETITMHNEVRPTESWELDALLAGIDPHKPIIDLPDMPDIDPLLATIDPHKPIIDPPDMPETTSKDTTLDLLNDWLHKAKDSVEHFTEKATPAASDWLHKAKDSVEHLTEKATPTANEWLHKAKELGNDLGSKGSSLGSETLVKGSSTLANLAASAKELTEKLTSNLSTKRDDLQKLTGIGPTFAAILHRAGIHSYQQLAETSHQKLQALLIVEDEQFSQHDTSSWPKQAALAAQGDWEQLKAYQDSL
jgi:predicted flap endonuclease-1-like 5' DNA nuclease